MRTDQTTPVVEPAEEVDLVELLASIDTDAQYERTVIPSPAVRPRVLDRERIVAQLTTRQKSTARDNALVLVDSYFTPRLAAGKEYHCLAYAYLSDRFNWTPMQVQRAVEYLRHGNIIQLVIRPSRNTGQPPIYKFNSDYLISEVQYDTIYIGQNECAAHCPLFAMEPPPVDPPANPASSPRTSVNKC